MYVMVVDNVHWTFCKGTLCFKKSPLLLTACHHRIIAIISSPLRLLTKNKIKYQKIGWDGGIKQQNSNMFNATDYSQRWNPCVVIIGAQHLELRLRCKGSAFERFKFYQIASQHYLYVNMFNMLSHQIWSCCVFPLEVLLLFFLENLPFHLRVRHCVEQASE